MEKRFEAIDKRFEATDKRFEAMDKRFETFDTKFNDLQTEMRDGFSNITSVLYSIQAPIGKPFEQFARNVVIRILEAEGQPNVKITPQVFSDTEHQLSKYNTDVQVDGYSENPPIIIEITSILRNTEKVDKFIEKKSFVENLKKKPFRGFFIAAGTEINEETKLDIIFRLRQGGSELINL